MSRYCQIHKDQSLSLICFHASCNNHLACVECLMENHANHYDSCYFIDEILKNDVKIINNSLSNTIAQFNEQKQVERQVEKDFRYIERGVLLKLDLLQDILNQQYHDLNEQKTRDLEIQFMKIFKNSTNCTKLNQQILLHYNQQLTRKELKKKIDEILQQQNEKQELINSYSALKNSSIKLSQKYIKSIESDIIGSLIDIPKNLASQKFIEFSLINGPKSTITDGNKLEISSSDVQMVMASKTLFQYPHKYTVVIKVEEYETSSQQALVIGFAHQSKNMNYNYFYRNGVSTYFGISNLSRSNYSIQKPEGKIIGDQIKQSLKQKKQAQIILQLDIGAKLVQMQYEDIKIVYSKKQSSKMNANSDMNCEQFFSKNKKFVMFFASQYASMKCKVY